MNNTKGGFTLPGQSGYEKLTLDMAEKWGADCIRDSDGTVLSPELTNSGIPIYSTICLVRSINAWAKQNMDKLQCNFLMSKPAMADCENLFIDPLDGYFKEQFRFAPGDEALSYWQVFDRTAEAEVPRDKWTFDGARVEISGTQPGHLYTVNFLATRIWEEISMYNHITNDWGDREHLMAVEPRYPETQAALLNFLDGWLKEHKHTSVVRFTSMFYNFCWIWGDEQALRHIYSDWGSYDFTANVPALKAFEGEYGYKMTSEDFVNNGRYNPVHNPPTPHIRDWMEFTGKFVREFGKKCIDLVHSYGKKAYVFYDDSWIGVEPWSGHFTEFGFDGLIKCVFNAFEARLCAGVPVKTHELRLHPYLFPTGLSGEPTFAPGGHPDEDAKRFWACVRRALLRVKIDRIGLGGYLNLIEPFPKFQDEIARIADEFRTIKDFHESGEPWLSGVKIGILHSWGSLRTWNCSGHMHEHPELPLNHINEALAGLPVELRAISFDDVAKNGVPGDIDVIINAGRAYDAWSGGEAWLNPALKAAINRFVAAGGGFIGVGEPTAARGAMRYFQEADVLGVDREVGNTICFNKYAFVDVSGHFITDDLTAAPRFNNHVNQVYALGKGTQVLAHDGADVMLAAHECALGRAVYMSGFTYSPENTRLLYRALLWAARREDAIKFYMPIDPRCECAYYPGANTLVAINNSADEVRTQINTPDGVHTVAMAPHGISIEKC